MAYTDQFTLGNDATFRGRVHVAVLRAAAAVQAESRDGLSIPSGYRGDSATLHEARIALAAKALADPATYAARFAAVVAADPNTAGITAASSDSDIQFTVNALWSAFSVGA